ncbi:MAG: hypothetical protein AB7U75_14995 [Hyphomicrobiaceae bacterium]
MVIVGIDTDAKGSLAILDFRQPKIVLDIYGIPNRPKLLKSGTKRIEVNFPALVAIMVELTSTVPVDKFYLEEQWGQKGDGPVGAFSFGRTFGDIRTATVAGLLGMGETPSSVESKIAYVPGGDWKAEMQLDSDKSKSIKLANKVFPACSKAWTKAKYVSAAEAALLALWGATREGVRIKPGSEVVAPESPILATAPSLVFEG